MKRCDECDPAIHPGACNWLDGMAKDDRCPHCGKPVYWFEPAPAGALMDAMSADWDED